MQKHSSTQDSFSARNPQAERARTRTFSKIVGYARYLPELTRP